MSMIQATEKCPCGASLKIAIDDPDAPFHVDVSLKRFRKNHRHQDRRRSIFEARDE